METVSMGEAARLVGRTKGALSKAISSGRLAVVEKTRHGYQIDVDELAKVYPPRAVPAARSSKTESPGHDVDETRMLRLELDLVRQQLEEMRSDRDAWRGQAQRLADR